MIIEPHRSVAEIEIGPKRPLSASFSLAPQSRDFSDSAARVGANLTFVSERPGDLPRRPARLANRTEVVVAGCRSPVIEAGPPEATEAAVFVHGNPGPGSHFRDLIRRVGELARAVTVDLPGFGKADKPNDFDYSIQGYAKHLKGVIDQLGIRRVHLISHDFGGPFAMQWAVDNPNSVASFCFIGTGLLEGYRWHYLARIWRTPILGDLFMLGASRAAFRLLLNRDNGQPLPNEFINTIWDNFDLGTRRAVLRLYRNTDLVTMSERLAAGLKGADLPALVIWGRHDPYIPVRFAEAQRRIFPRAKVVILENSGHWPFVDDPTGVAAELLPFLRQNLLHPELESETAP